MAVPRTKAILCVLARGREPRLVPAVLRVFGASSLEECLATYDAVGKAERAALDSAVERVTSDAGAAFSLGVDNESRD